eukprot:c7695_g1_i1.p1 GENE.c7695_g1_i1~~c7695_g1_i1.p1  ORF type:complete len:470 (+),score=85.02 c7695_g1_i1:705-2114(+)
MQKASHSTKVCGTVWKHHYTSTSRSCTTFENSLHNGRELTLLDLKPLDLENSFSGVSVEECGNTCLQAAQVGCDGFSFHPTTGSTSGRCVLHGYGAVSKNAESSTLISGKCRIVDNLGDARCSPSVPGSHSGSVFWISDFVPSRDLCSELCARNVSCSAFSFAVLPDSSFGRCSLHRLGKVSNRMFGKQKAVVGTCDRTSTCQLHEPREHSRGISDRYLVYQPQFGLGNQVISLGVAVVWAQALSRVLVVPHFFSPRATSDVVADHAAWISYRELFDIQYLRSRYADLTIIEMDEFLKWNPSAKPIRVENTNLGKSTAVEWSTKYFQMLNFPDAEVSHMPGLFNTMTPEEVSVAFGGCGGIQTLAFMSMCGTFECFMFCLGLFFLHFICHIVILFKSHNGPPHNTCTQHTDTTTSCRPLHSTTSSCTSPSHPPKHPRFSPASRNSISHLVQAPCVFTFDAATSKSTATN